MKIIFKSGYGGDYNAIFIDGKPAFGYKHDDEPIGVMNQLLAAIGRSEVVEYGGEMTDTEMEQFS